jgi:methanogenic corrinoid protein MtbC1
MVPTPIDLRTAAVELGVHYQTAYKWVRTGALGAALIQGRYLLDAAEVAAFAQRRAQPAPSRPRRPRQSFEPLAQKMYEHLAAGDERAARAMVARLIDEGVALTTVISKLLVPALRRFGAEWHAGRLSIWVEHQASAIVDRILGSHHPSPRGRRRGTAVVAALAGDHHVLPTSMAAAALREDNWRVHHLGADMPGDELIDFSEHTQLDLAVLTMTTVEISNEVEHTARRLEERGLRTLIGRPGDSLNDLTRMAREL